MTLPVPNLDDKRWSELVEDAIVRVPLFSTQWTDHNIHDPGRTFVELFAWLAEFQRYRLAQTPNQTSLSFLKLVGMAPKPLVPARVEVSLDADLAETLLLHKGTGLVPIGNERTAFQTAHDFFVTANALTRVTTEFEDRRVDQTKANEALDIAFFAFQQDAVLGSLLELEFKGWFSPRELEFDLSIWLAEDDLPPIGQHVDEPSQVTPSATVQWEYHDGSGWKEITLVDDGTKHFHTSGHIRFSTPASPVNPSGAFKLRCTLRDGRFEIPPKIRRIALNTIEAVQIENIVNEDLGAGTGKPDQTATLQQTPILETVDSGSLEVGDILDWEAFLQRLADPNRSAPIDRLRRQLDGDLQAELAGLEDPRQFALLRSPSQRAWSERLHYRLIQNLALPAFREEQPVNSCPTFPRSDRPTPDQATARRRLSSIFPDLISEGPLILQVEEVGADGLVVWETWSRVDDFRESGPTDRHYTLDTRSGRIRFGNGLNGRVPQPKDRIRARHYRRSVGGAGNLPAGQVWEILEGSIRLTGRNQRGAAGGSDIEAIADARVRAQGRFHQRIRGLTAADFAELALATPGLRVARAKALPNRHPAFQGLEVPGAMTVLVVPARRMEDVRPPVPGQGFLETVARHLESHRLVTTEIKIRGPRYRPFGLSARVFLRRHSSETEARKRLKSTLEAFFDPLSGGPEGQGWPFGRGLFASEVYALLDADPGVDYLVALRFNDGEVDQPLALAPTELPHFSWDQTQLSFVAFETRTQVLGRNGSESEVHS